MKHSGAWNNSSGASFAWQMCVVTPLANAPCAKRSPPNQKPETSIREPFESHASSSKPSRFYFIGIDACVRSRAAPYGLFDCRLLDKHKYVFLRPHQRIKLHHHIQYQRQNLNHAIMYLAILTVHAACRLTLKRSNPIGSVNRTNELKSCRSHESLTTSTRVGPCLLSRIFLCPFAACSPSVDCPQIFAVYIPQFVSFDGKCDSFGNKPASTVCRAWLRCLLDWGFSLQQAFCLETHNFSSWSRYCTQHLRYN